MRGTDQVTEESDESILRREMDKCVDELDALSNRSEMGRLHTAEEIWSDLESMGIEKNTEDRANIELYVKGKVPLSELMRLIKEQHEELG